MATPTQILGVDSDPQSQKQLVQAFKQAGMVLRYIPDARKTAGALKQFKADLILVNAELPARETGLVISSVLGNASTAGIPIVLLCSDTSEMRFLAELRTGVVELLPKPFSPTHVARVRALVTELPQRSGAILGQGDARELAALVAHLKWTQRSGALVLNPRMSTEAQVLFARGEVKSARADNLTGEAALRAILARPRASWRFTEVSGASDEGAGVVIELDSADQERVPIVEEDGSDLGIEVSLEGDEPLISTAPAPAPARPAPVVDPQDPVSLLLVDDEPELCRMFSIIFKRHGFEVSTATDGVEGYESATQGSFDVVVADLSMPRMDGWGLLRLLREDFRTREVPVAFLSCHDDFRESLKAFNAGAQAYFSKSIKLEELVGQVNQLLVQRRQFRRDLRKGQPLSFPVATLGPQWVLRELARQRLTAQLDAKDSWATYRLQFNAGQPVYAVAQAGQHRAEGERAFNAFVASRGATAWLAFAPQLAPQNLKVPLAELLGRAAGLLNENERKVREGQLLQGKQIQVNHDLYGLYTQIGPKQWLETARLICEEHLPPREILGRVNLSPVEIEDTLRDLIRRGVVTLSA